VTSTKDTFSFKAVLPKLPQGEPLSSQALRLHGLSKFHAPWLARHGWLRRLGRDAYIGPSDKLTREGALAFLSARIPGFHVGGKTALAWRGVRHNVAVKERLTLWGDQPVRLPAWFTARFDAHFQVTNLFDESMPKSLGLQPLPGGRPEILVSVPERALLELLSDVGKTESLEEAGHLVESIRSLREEVLDELLAHIKRIKVVRLAEKFAADADLPWASVARTHSKRLGGGARWIAVSKSGERLDLRRR